MGSNRERLVEIIEHDQDIVRFSADVDGWNTNIAYLQSLICEAINSRMEFIYRKAYPPDITDAAITHADGEDVLDAYQYKKGTIEHLRYLLDLINKAVRIIQRLNSRMWKMSSTPEQRQLLVSTDSSDPALLDYADTPDVQQWCRTAEADMLKNTWESAFAAMIDVRKLLEQLQLFIDKLRPLIDITELEPDTNDSGDTMGE